MDTSSFPTHTSKTSQPNHVEQENSPQKPRKRNPAFSKESLRSTLEEISRETEQISQVLPKQPEKEDTHKKIQQLDQRQSVWLRLFIVWLIYNLRGFAELFIDILSGPEIPEELEEFEDQIMPLIHLGILMQFGMVLITSSPYLIQLWAIYKKNLKRTNTFIRIMKVLIVLNVISLAFNCLTLYEFDNLKEMISSGMFKIPEEQMEVLNLYLDKEYVLFTLYEVAESLVCFLLCLGAAIKYRNYLMQRESLMQTTNKDD